jgi:hypothetical protein
MQEKVTTKLFGITANKGTRRDKSGFGDCFPPDQFECFVCREDISLLPPRPANNRHLVPN